VNVYNVKGEISEENMYVIGFLLKKKHRSENRRRYNNILNIYCGLVIWPASCFENAALRDESRDQSVSLCSVTVI